MARDTKKLGDISEAKLVASLLEVGETVLKPFGDNQRYDLGLEREGKLFRVQCKTGRLRRGSILFETSSVAFKGRSTPDQKAVRRGYLGEIEYFGVYCPQTRECYLVPASAGGSLRVDPEGATAKSRMAEDFRIGR